MKKIKTLAVAMLILTISSIQAQVKRPMMDKMHENKWRIMMSQVKLTNDEMALVKPIFLDYEQAVWKIHKERMDKFMEFKKRRFSETVDYNSLNDRYINSEIRQAQLLRDYHLKLKKILTPETLFNYYMAERSFKRKLLREMPPPPDDRDRN